MTNDEKLSMTPSQMVKDLKYANDILQLNVEDAKKVDRQIRDYLERTNMIPYRDQVQNLSKEDIQRLSIDDINNMFPGHELVPWFDPVVKDLPGDYGYTVDEYHEILTVLNGHLNDYTHMIDMINQSIGYIQKMSDTLQQARRKQAEELIQSGKDDGSAKRYLDDLDRVNTCSDFFDYVRENSLLIAKSQSTWLERYFMKWAEKNSSFKTLPDRVMSCSEIDLGDESRKYLLKCIYSYLRYREHDGKRTKAIHRDVLFNLNEFFSGNITNPETIREGIHNIMKG